MQQDGATQLNRTPPKRHPRSFRIDARMAHDLTVADTEFGRWLAGAPRHAAPGLQ
jgi:hypothetical protein